MHIYKITNDLTNEIYIGQTKLTLRERLLRHISDARASFECRRREFCYFHRKIMFYGPEHFHIELIETVPQEEVNEREQYWIEFYDTYKNGYNSTLGGQNQISQQQKQVNQKWEIRPQNPKISAPGAKNNQAAAKSVICYNDLGEQVETFSSIKKAADKYQVGIQTISRALRLGGDTLSAHFRWRYEKENIATLEPLRTKPNRSLNKIPDTQKPIIQYTKDKNFIREWTNAYEAGHALNINSRCIIYTCNNKQKSAGGHFWQFKT